MYTIQLSLSIQTKKETYKSIFFSILKVADTTNKNSLNLQPTVYVHQVHLLLNSYSFLWIQKLISLNFTTPPPSCRTHCGFSIFKEKRRIKMSYNYIFYSYSKNGFDSCKAKPKQCWVCIRFSFNVDLHLVHFLSLLHLVCPLPPSPGPGKILPSFHQGHESLKLFVVLFIY